MQKFFRGLVFLVLFVLLALIGKSLIDGSIVPNKVLLLAGFMLNGAICGSLCAVLASKKDYSGYFVTGFLLGIPGLIYVAGLPLNADVKKVGTVSA